MNVMIKLACACALGLSAPSAFAQPKPAQENSQQSCKADPQRGQKNCQQPVQQKQGQKQSLQKEAHHAPRPGDSAKAGRPFQQAKNSRLAQPKHGQEYRVVQDRVVLVDSKTLQILTVVGLLNTILK